MLSTRTTLLVCFCVVVLLLALCILMIFDDIGLQYDGYAHSERSKKGYIQTNGTLNFTPSLLSVYNPQEKNKFSLLIDNPNICSDAPDLKYIFYVHSSAGNFKQRHVLRSTWLNSDFIMKKRMRRVFMLGRYDGTDEKGIRQNIQSESKLFGDIVQGDYHEAYRNLSLKGLMAMKWLSERCSKAKLVIKFDDDVVLDIIKLLHILAQYERKKRSIFCQVFVRNPILRDPKTCSRWCLDPAVLAGEKFYPKHCSGPVYAMTPDLPLLLHKASRSAEFVWVDDAYITGVLPKYIHRVTFKTNNRTWQHSKKSNTVLTTWGDYWKKLIDQKETSPAAG